MENLNVGEICLWYAGADKSHKPSPAMVMSTNGKGMLDLTVFSPVGQMHRRGVRHVTDPELIERPQCREYSGGWEYVIAARPPLHLNLSDKASGQNKASRKMEIGV